jgi:DNA-binding transcriptional LysR family regulator
MTLRQLQALLALADSGSISAAARALGVTQPVLSRVLSQLGRSSGVSLVARGPLGTILTRPGQRLAERARLISAELKRCEEDLLLLRGEQGGQISLAASPVPMMLVIPGAIQQVLHTLPGTEVTVAEIVYPELIDAFREQRIDFAIGPVPDGGLGGDLRAEPLFQVERVIVVARDHPKSHVRTLAALQSEPWIITGPLNGPGAAVRQLFLDHGMTPPHCGVALDTVWAAIDMVSHNGFVGSVPRPIAEAAGSRIRILKIREEMPPLTICLITQAGVQLTTAARALVSAVRARSARRNSRTISNRS